MSITPVLISGGAVYPYDHATGSGPVVTWSGAYPYLDTADGSGSYGTPSGQDTYVVGVQLSAFTPTGATLTGQWQVKPLFVGTNEFSFRLYDGGTFLAQSAQVSVEQPGDAWLDGSVTFDVTPEIVDAAQRGDLIFARSAYNPGPISCLFLDVAEPHLRQRLRGRVRVRNHASRQRSVRVRGFL